MQNNSIVWVGLDTDSKKSQVALYRGADEAPAAEWEAAMDRKGVARLIDRLKREEGEVRCVYEAGPNGYDFCRQLRKAGIQCEVIAPSLIPKRPGDRIKTNRRDARNLGRLYRAGELTVIAIPDEKQEALRDLMRAREDVREDLTRRQHRLNRFLVRQGFSYREGQKWTKRHWAWIKKIRFEDSNRETVYVECIRAVEQSIEQLKMFDSRVEENAQKPEYARRVAQLKTLRGVKTVTAMTVVAEVGDMRRYGTAPQFMASTGLVTSEHSTGEKQRRGGITKTGNTHLRRVLVESGWHYRHRSIAGAEIRKRRKGQSPHVIAIAEKAEQRLNRKFRRMVDRYNKPSQVAAVAVARELAGFIWAIGIEE